MVLKLYGFPLSTCTKRVAVVLAEKKVPFEFFPVERADTKSEEYVKKQPFGQVPYLDDDGFVLFESRAIARYIIAKYPDQGPELIPSDPKANALFEQAASIESFDFNVYAERAVAEKIFLPRKGIPTNVEAYDASLKALSAKLDVYDTILSKQKYLAGNEITVADLFHLPYADMLKVAGSDLMEEKPNVTRWWKDISSRESWTSLKEGVKSTA